MISFSWVSRSAAGAVVLVSMLMAGERPFGFGVAGGKGANAKEQRATYQSLELQA
jgi:hypothetical protein